MDAAEVHPAQVCRKNLKAAADHLTDFEPPLYNVWKQQEKSKGLAASLGRICPSSLSDATLWIMAPEFGKAQRSRKNRPDTRSKNPSNSASLHSRKQKA